LKSVKYYSVGTVEFLLDESGHFYFMEVNTRIQVEHTVTEELVGLDLVALQLQIAQGERLPFKQKDIELSGHVIQFRINAENPLTGFSPSPGLLEHFVVPGGPHVRVDTACYSGYRIPPHYDSMIAKLIVKGRSRKEAIARAKRAIQEFHIQGVATTLGFHAYMLQELMFQESDYTINTIDRWLEEGKQLACSPLIFQTHKESQET
jgi:acetyl-CoA carboxylase biotin carboxylase subunit